VSVGHVARAIEESGIPTVTIMTKAFAHRASEMSVPRTLVVRHPVGRPMGAPFDTSRHMSVLNAAFDLFELTTVNGNIVELSEAYRPMRSDG
jgi:hypothetical protein